MGRAPCCDEIGVKKGPWTPEEDKTDLNLFTSSLNLIKLQADATHLAKLQLAQGLLQVLTTTATTTSNSNPNMDLVGLMGLLSSLRNYEGFVNSNNSSPHGIQGSHSSLSSLPNMGFENQIGEFQPPINHGPSPHELRVESNGTSNNLYTSSTTNSNAMPPLVSATNSENAQMYASNSGGSVPLSSPSSTLFDAWEGLNLEDLNNDFGLKDMLE
uniref:Uncharacterized protein n=1 Tax=Ananas comosus var. bracteatus TaxID=296719 RepID=A0A6V7NQN1_ANACO|nr:unnamed protein product [Ananas comosus var. bracteatus]